MKNERGVQPDSPGGNWQPRRRVVITGMGAITALGLNVADYWRNLVAGASGIDRITLFDASPFPCQVAAEVKGFDPKEYLDHKEARRTSRFIQFAIVATQMALKDAELTIDDSNATQIGVLLGTGIGSLTTTEQEARVLLDRGVMRVNAFFLPMMLPNMAAGQVSRAFGAKAYNSTVVTACASSTQAIGEALEVIRRGDAEVMITGGAEASLCALGMAGFCVLRALSSRNHEPTKASRPFDGERDGMVPAEGAGILILESLNHALARGASIHAEVAGFASTADAYHVVAPDPEAWGSSRAMRLALEDAGVAPSEVDYINAHATSTVAGDTAETVAIKKVFGQEAYRVPISATKSMIGHSMGAAGALEVIASVMTIREGVIHPTINYEVPDPTCDLDYVPNVCRKAKARTVLSNSFGFGGQNACLVLRRYVGDM